MTAPCWGRFSFGLNSSPFSVGGLETPELVCTLAVRHYVSGVSSRHCSDRKYLALGLKTRRQTGRLRLHCRHDTKHGLTYQQISSVKL
jgi:hypothetical protein